MPAPLYDALKNFLEKDTLRLHMPGHKGKPLPAPEFSSLAPLDLTELPGTGNLYEAGEPFDAAQGLWADRFGFETCQFLTGGSTQGLHTALALFCRPGEKVLMDRGCHRAVYNALALLDLDPVFLTRPWLQEENLTGPISPEEVEQTLERDPELKTVCITSPTYCGVLSNIGTISRIIHAHGGKLLVDGAHGAHLPFLGLAPFWGADAVVVSAHKTLPAMGQAALLFTNGVDPDRVRRTASVFGTSSPSYPILASIDLARDWLEGEGGEEYRRAACRCLELRRRFPCLGRDRSLSLDPCRLTALSPDGPALARALERAGIFPEMSDAGHVVFILTCADSDGDLSRLAAALEENVSLLGPGPALPPPPLPERKLSPRQAMFAPSRSRPLEDCEGEVSACQIAPYPPGVPVVAPGELIGKKELASVRNIEYNMKSVIQTVV